MKDDVLHAWMDTILFRERSQTPRNSAQCCGNSIVRGLSTTSNAKLATVPRVFKMQLLYVLANMHRQ